MNQLPRHLPLGLKVCSARTTRGGTTYVVVLGVATIVSVLGMSGLMVSRLQYRQAVQSRDWTEAGDLALSAIELGILRISQDTSWRTNFTNNAEITPISFGNGTLSFKLVDAALGLSGGDGNLNNNTYDPVRLYGIGRVGSTTRVYSVLLVGDTGLDVLRTCVATSGYLNNNVTSTALGGALSTNGLFTRGAVVNGNVDAASVTGSAAINGILTTPATAKAMPDKTVFDGYMRLATPLTWAGSSGNWNMVAPLLSATTNPFGAGTNPNGIYYVNVPANSTLTIQVNHIKGTLVVDCQDKSKVDISQKIYWEPNRSDKPILLIRHLTTSAAKDIIQPQAGTVTEGVNTYTSQLKGLVHIFGPAGTPSGSLEANIGNGGTFNGTLIIDEDAKILSSSATFIWDSNLFLNPPIGYSTGPSMKILSGSAQWEAAP